MIADREGLFTPADRDLAGLAVAGLTADSRQVRPGMLFAALPGSRTDGRRFIADAVRAGAVAVLAPEGTELPVGAETVRLITDPEPRRRFARMAAALYHRQPSVIAGVTGTNGKTSTVHFLRQIWTCLGHRAGAVGTLGLTAPTGELPGTLTTPDPAALHAALAELAEGGVTHLAMEASSHGLDQFRLDGVAMRLAGFTNLTRDHLDYHGSMAAYRQAKWRLFEALLLPDGAAVIHVDTEEGRRLADHLTAARRRVLTTGRRGDAVRLDDLATEPAGQVLSLTLAGRRHRARLPLVGGFQVDNALVALGLAVAGGAAPEAAVAALEELNPVRGRLERVGLHPSGAPVFVDYAHTPDALSAVLTALRPHVAGRLVAVFGCGGDRDPGKRPEMGAVVHRLADRAIVTDDNPRTEDPAAIRRAVLAACPGAAEIGDREAAIRAGLDGLADGDALVIAGKGHETGQTIGTEIRPFDDAAVTRRALADLAPTTGAAA